MLTYLKRVIYALGGKPLPTDPVTNGGGGPSNPPKPPI